MPNKNVPVQGNVPGASITSSTPTASDGYSGQLSSPTMHAWPVDTSLPMQSNSEVSSVGNMMPSLMNFGGGLLGAGLSYLFNNSMFNKQVAEQKRREQFQLQWRNEEREYNSPAAQIARLNDAGLNGKLLLAQQGLTQGQTAPQTGSVSPGMDASAPGAAFANSSASAANLLMQQKLMQAQIDNIDAQTSKTQAETMLLPEQLKGISLSNKGQDLSNKSLSMSNDTYSYTQDYIITQARLQTEAQDIQNQMQKSNQELLDIQVQIQKAYGLKNAKASYEILTKQVDKLREEIVNLRKQGKNIDADTLLKKASTAVQNELAKLTHAQTDKTKAETAKTRVDTDNAYTQGILMQYQINETDARTQNIRRNTATIPVLSDSQAHLLGTALVNRAIAEVDALRVSQDEMRSRIRLNNAHATWQEYNNQGHSYNPANYKYDVFGADRALFRVKQNWPIPMLSNFQ